MKYKVRIASNDGVAPIPLAQFTFFDNAVDYMQHVSKTVSHTRQVEVFEGRKLRVSKPGEVEPGEMKPQLLSKR